MLENIFSNPDVIMAIITVIAIISPLGTTWMNNRHQLEIKKIEIYQTSKKNALTNFINSAERYIILGKSADNKTILDFHSSINHLYIYFSINNVDMFEDLESTIKRNNLADANEELTNIVVNLSQQVTKE